MRRFIDYQYKDEILITLIFVHKFSKYFKLSNKHLIIVNKLKFFHIWVSSQNRNEKPHRVRSMCKSRHCIFCIEKKKTSSAFIFRKLNIPLSLEGKQYLQQIYTVDREHNKNPHAKKILKRAFVGKR